MGHLPTKYKACIHVGFNAFMKDFYIKSMILENLLFGVSFFYENAHFFIKSYLFYKKNSISHIYKNSTLILNL